MFLLYLDVFRPARWYRNIFVLIGTAIYFMLLRSTPLNYVFEISVGFVICCLVSSGNYGLNEYFDKKSDKAHPTKKHRALASGKIDGKSVIAISIVLYLLAIYLSLQLFNYMFFVSVALFIVSGLAYNIPPVRFKDYPYLDFLFEALNNPIRLLIGWYLVASPSQLVPSSFILGYWTLGIFLMAAKRFGEIRFIGSKEDQALYRKSLMHYTEEKLLISIICGLSIFMFVFGIIVMKYSIDLVMLIPFLVLHIAWFFLLLFEENTIIKDPERVLEKKWFFLHSLFIVIVGLAIFNLKLNLFVWLT